jgi:hypothetical protein
LPATATVRTEASAKSSAAALVGHERGVEHRALVPAVVADDRKAAGEGRGGSPAATGPIGAPTVPLSPPPPCSRKRPFQSSGKREREADRVVLAVGALVRIERAFDAAIGGQAGCGGARGRAGRAARRRRASRR